MRDSETLPLEDVNNSRLGGRIAAVDVAPDDDDGDGQKPLLGEVARGLRLALVLYVWVAHLLEVSRNASYQAVCEGDLRACCANTLVIPRDRVQRAREQPARARAACTRSQSTTGIFSPQTGRFLPQTH